MNNTLSYYGLIVARISASEKDLPVKMMTKNIPSQNNFALDADNFSCLS